MGIRARKRAERRQLLASRRSSGMTRKEFCEYHEIPLTTLASWERAERKLSAVTPQLLAVEIQDNTAVREQLTRGFALNLVKGRRIEASWQFDDADLMRLIRAVERA